MLLTYMDESYTRDRYYIAGVCVPDTVARPLAHALDEVVHRASRDYGVPWQAELHGHALMKGSEDWERMKEMIRARIAVYTQAMEAIGTHDVHIFLCGLDVARQRERYKHYRRTYSPHEVVLQHLMERVNAYARRQHETVLLIADEVDEPDSHRHDLWNYQHYGTPGYLSSKLGQIVDTIHFAPSDSSRLLQAADLLAFMHRRRETHTERDGRAKAANDLLWSHVKPRIRHQRCWVP